MKLVKPSGTLGKRTFCDYFSHIGKRPDLHSNKRKCTHGGESVIHRMAKQKLREMVGKYSFTLFQCVRCGDERYENGRGCSVTIEVRSDDGKWRYDCVLSRNGLPIVALEVVHTHKTGDEKISAVRSSGIEIVEFRAEDVMQMGDVLENLNIRRGVCYCCLVELSLKWQRDCFVDELFELMDQEEMISSNYTRMMRIYHIVSTVEPMLNKCKQLLKLGFQYRVKLCIPELKEEFFVCTKTVKWEHGLVVYCGLHRIFVVLLQNMTELHERKWNKWKTWKLSHSAEGPFCIFLECTTILHRLGSLAEDVVILSDCRSSCHYQVK